jgi:superfamily II DNA helicase RecQ
LYAQKIDHDTNVCLFVGDKTGKGKSLIPYVSAAMLGGVAISIVPSIPLGTNQCEKLLGVQLGLLHSDDTNIEHPVTVYHLEQVDSEGRTNETMAMLKGLVHVSVEEELPSILMFCGPKVLFTNELKDNSELGLLVLT